MATLAVHLLAKRGQRDDRRRAEICCPYCKERWGPWHGLAIDACIRCRRPLFLTRSLNRLADDNRVSAVLDTINMAQGLASMAAIAAMLTGLIAPRTLGQIIAMAMFVAATAYATDGVLGLTSNVVRTFGHMVRGPASRAASIMKIILGVIAFALSFVGIVIFSGNG